MSPDPRVDGATCLRQRARVLCQSAETGGFLVDPDSGVCWELNTTGARIWSLIDGTRTLATMAAILADTEAVEAETLERDVLTFARGLMTAGLVELVNPG